MRKIILLVLAAVLLSAPVIAQTPTPPPAVAKVSDTSDLSAGYDAFRAMATALLDEAIKDHPERVPQVVDAALASLRSSDETSASADMAEMQICAWLFEHNVPYALVLFETIEAKPREHSSEVFLLLRIYAGMRYAGAERHALAAREFDAAAGSPEADDNCKFMAYFFHCLAASEPAERERQRQLAMALPGIKHQSAFMPVMIMRLQCANNAKEQALAVEDLQKLASTISEPKLGGFARVMTAVMLENATAKTGAIRDAFEFVRQGKEEPEDHVISMAVAAAMAKEAAPTLVLPLVTDAEAYAKAHMDAHSETVRLIRLMRAKVLRDAGASEELKQYSDLDLTEVVLVTASPNMSVDVKDHGAQLVRTFKSGGKDPAKPADK